MSLLYIDGFDSYGYLPYRWDKAYPSDMFTIVSGIGRTGNNALKIESYAFQTEYYGFTADIENLGMGRTIPETNDIIIGFSFKPFVTDAGYVNIDLLYGDVIQSKIKFRSEEIAFATADNTITGTHYNFDNWGRQLLFHDDWSFVEVYVSFGTANSGTVNIRANEYVAYQGTSLPTAVIGNSIDGIRFYLDHDTPTSSEYLRLDDLYICNTSGTTNNSFLGNITIETMYPKQDGTYSQFTLSSGTPPGTAHNTLVNDYQLDNNTEYNHTYEVQQELDDGCNLTTSSGVYITISQSNEINKSWFRFTGINIPRGAKINRAELILKHHSSDSSPTGNILWTCQDIGFSTLIENETDWDAANKTIAMFPGGVADVSPLVTDPVQQVVNRHDWVERNGAITLFGHHPFITGVNIRHRNVYGWELDGDNNAKIEIDWTLPHDDGTYIEATTTGTIDTFKYDFTTISGETFLGIQHNIATKNNDISDYYIRMLLEDKTIIDTTEYSQELFASPGSDTTANLGYFNSILELNPKTSLGWTYDDLVALEAGVTTVSGYSGNIY